MKRLSASIIELTQSEQFKRLVAQELGPDAKVDMMVDKVESIVEQRLGELTPELVKEIVQKDD